MCIEVICLSACVYPADMGQSSSSVRLRSGGSGSCRRRRLLRPGSEPLQVNIVSVILYTHMQMMALLLERFMEKKRRS